MSLPLLEELQLSQTAKAALVRVARRMADGFEGEITLIITRGGVRAIKWVQHENGNEIKEDLG